MAVNLYTSSLHICVVLCIVITLTLGFNLDTTIPVIKVGPADSYFGFSVAQHQQLRRISTTSFDPSTILGNYILVGAPNLDLPFMLENNTGGVYKCDATSSRPDDCELLLTNEYNSAAGADKGKNHQWLGVTVRSGGPGKAVVACAHRFKEIKTSGTSENIYGIGSCYQLTQELEFNLVQGQGQKVRPCQGYAKDKEHEEYAFCQAGISAYITEEERLVMGSPGAINWRGMLNEVDVSPRFVIKKLYRSPTTEADPVPPPVPLISYLGYSVVGGVFDNTGQTYYVAGAPRSFNTGQVVFFTEMTTGSILKYEESQILSGDLPFSGYGQDLIALDINNDGFDDLVVGCPFYFAKEKDNIRIGGAVYVYIGNGDMITQFTRPQVILGRSISQEECDKLECLHARFGFSLAAAGDLNKDSFEDFAVGAPYEGRGAVYVFHGSTNGVKEPFSQRIYAEDLGTASGWNTFGYSLSGGLDLDSNSYSDLLVGSYMENKVALLRTRPIIALHSKVDISPKKLNMSTDAQRKCQHDNRMRYCVEVKLCLRYTAEPVDRFDDPVDIIYTIMAEPDRLAPRVEFLKDGSFTHKIDDTFQLLSQKTTGLSPNDPNAKFACISQTAYLKDQITDVLSAIEFGIGYRLPDKAPPVSPGPGQLPDINEFPILDAGMNTAETQMLIAEVEFAKQCGDDQVCKSNLQMKVMPELRRDTEDNLVLEIGNLDILTIRVDIENIGEIAYQTAFYLTKPKSLTWQQAEPKDIGCAPFNETLIECKDIGSKELGKPLKPGAVTEFALLFQVDNRMISTVRSILLTAWVNTTSEEVTPVDDHVTIPIVVYVNADLEVVGRSEPDSSIPYSGEIRGESAITNERMIGQSVNHTFTVYNNGPGVVESSEVTIYWPYELASKYPQGKHLLYLMHAPQVLDGGDATCYEQSQIVNVVGIAVDNTGTGPEYNVQNGRRKRQAESSDNKPMEIREGEPKVGEAREKKNVVLLDCGKKTAKCYEIRCRIGILNVNQNVRIRIRSRLWESTLLEDFREVDEVHIRSTGKIHIRPELNVVQSDTKNDIGYATTIAIPSLKIVQEKPIAWWIIALAVLGGIFLLIVLALCLWKVGFFKRRRYEEVSSYSVKVEKKKNIDNPTYSTRVETKKDYLDESEILMKH